jgi:cobalamin biosynthesis protein CbiD
MKLMNLKSMLKKGVTAGLLAGAVALAAPTKANAEVVVGIGVRAPYYNRACYYERLRIEEARRHEAWVRAHERSYYGYRRGW